MSPSSIQCSDRKNRIAVRRARLSNSVGSAVGKQW
jgi:hypothetical protein